MGNSICQCDNLNNNIIGIMKKSDVSFLDTKQKANNKNNLLKLFEAKIPDNNTNINTNNNNDFLKIQSIDGMSKVNKSSKDNLNNMNPSSKNNIKIKNPENNEEEEEEEDDDIEGSPKIKKSEEIRKTELINIFDDLMYSYAEYMTEEEYEKELNNRNNTIIEIEKKLEPITVENSKIKELINDKIFDRPPLKFNENKSIYKGMWNINGEKEGFGVLIDKDGNKYIGGWKEDKFNGYGRIISKNGEYYEGEWVNGVMEGNGKYNNKEYTYIGNFKNNKFNGKGKIKYNNGMIYEGNFENGYKEGKGKLIFEDGSYYEGNFKLNNYEEGKFKFKDGRYYSGKWLNNNMEGEGKFNWEKNIYYRGEYKNNMRNGKGVYHFGEKNKLEGEWKNNLPHGEGILTYENKKIEGEFRYGKFIKGMNAQEEISSPKKKRGKKKSIDNTSSKIDKTDKNSKNNKKK